MIQKSQKSNTVNGCLIVLCFFVISSCNNKHAVDSKPVKVGENWPHRSSFDLRIQFSNEQNYNAVTAWQEVHVDLFKLNAGKHLCFWTIKSVKSPSTNDMMDEFLSITEGVQQEILINEKGEVESLLNWTSIQKKGYNAIHEVIKSLETDPETEQLRVALWTSTNALLKDKDAVELYCLKFPKYFFGLANIRLNPKDTIRRDAFLMAPFTNMVITYQQKIILDTVYSDSTCNISMIDDLNQNFMREMSQSIVSGITGKDMKREMSEYADSFKMTHQVQYTVDIITGLVNKLSVERNTTVGEGSRIEKIQITRTD